MSTNPVVRNGWYMGAWSDEVGRTLLQRWIVNRPVCFYRLQDGSVTAIEDRCPHRRYPLCWAAWTVTSSSATTTGNGSTPVAAASAWPSNRTRPGASVHRFPLVERDGVVWIWPGYTDAADPASIPDVGWLSDPGWTHAKGLVPLAARHALLAENLLDLTHEKFLHTGSIGNAAVAATPVAVTSEGDHVSFTRQMVGVEASPFYERSMGLTSPVDRWQDGDFHAPGVFVLSIRLAPTGTQEPDAFHVKVLYGLTQATDTTTHDFFALGRDYRTDDAELSAFQLAQQLAVMQEDVDALEIQETMVATDPSDTRESNIRSDRAGIRGRRMLEKLARS